MFSSSPLQGGAAARSLGATLGTPLEAGGNTFVVVNPNTGLPFSALTPAGQSAPLGFQSTSYSPKTSCMWPWILVVLLIVVGVLFAAWVLHKAHATPTDAIGYDFQ